MAESQKIDASLANSKGKNFLLDADFGKDFLSSWKSTSVAEDDAMDFGFGTVAKGKKKAFNFDKMDVDFSLDGNLDKLSSFKIDISDLDISSPPKKARKPKERSKKESAGGNHQQMQDHFTFPFDFNELDSFSFESSIMKGGTKFNKNEDCKEASNRIECQGSRIDPTEDIGASQDGVNSKLTPSGSVTTSKMETCVAGLGDVDSINKNFPSNSVPNDSSSSKSATVQNLVASEDARTLPEKTITSSTQEIDQGSHHQQEKTSSPKPSAQETMQDLSIQSVSENESTQNTPSELQVEVCSLATKVTGNVGREQNVDWKLVTGLGLNCEYSLVENSHSQLIARSLSNDGERDRFGSDNNILTGNVDGTEPAQDDSDSADTSTTSVPRESNQSMPDTEINRDNQNANAEVCLATLSSGTSVGKLIQIKETETGVIQSKFPKRSDGKESQSQQTTSTQTKLTMLGGKTIGSKQQTDKRRDGTEANDARSRSKLVRISTLHSRELNKGVPVQPGSASSVKGLKGIGECFNADLALNGSKLIGPSRLHDQEVTKGQPVHRSEKNVKNLITLSSCVNPSSSFEETNKSTTQNCATPRLPASTTVSIKNSNNVFGEGNKTSPLKADRSLPDLSSLKISRTMGVNHIPSSSTFHKQIKSLRYMKEDMEFQGSAAYKIAHSVSTEKQTSPAPSLKRKTFEASNADMLNLNPSKRLSQSPTECRYERVADKEACNNVNPADNNTNNVFKDCQPSTLDIPRDVNMTELQIHLVMENDDNVEKAGAYMKELEDICNMLKKKHEEAKEILVRAIVNNNNLLMLNHPIYEEKIRKVQKFAAQLMSKELHTNLIS